MKQEAPSKNLNVRLMASEKKKLDVNLALTGQSIQAWVKGHIAKLPVEVASKGKK